MGCAGHSKEAQFNLTCQEEDKDTNDGLIDYARLATLVAHVERNAKTTAKEITKSLPANAIQLDAYLSALLPLDILELSKWALENAPTGDSPVDKAILQNWRDLGVAGLGEAIAKLESVQAPIPVYPARCLRVHWRHIHYDVEKANMALELAAAQGSLSEVLLFGAKLALQSEKQRQTYVQGVVSIMAKLWGSQLSKQAWDGVDNAQSISPRANRLELKANKMLTNLSCATAAPGASLVCLALKAARESSQDHTDATDDTFRQIFLHDMHPADDALWEAVKQNAKYQSVVDALCNLPDEAEVASAFVGKHWRWSVYAAALEAIERGMNPDDTSNSSEEPLAREVDPACASALDEKTPRDAKIEQLPTVDIEAPRAELKIVRGDKVISFELRDSTLRTTIVTRGYASAPPKVIEHLSYDGENVLDQDLWSCPMNKSQIMLLGGMALLAGVPGIEDFCPQSLQYEESGKLVTLVPSAAGLFRSDLHKPILAFRYVNGNLLCYVGPEEGVKGSVKQEDVLAIMKLGLETCVAFGIPEKATSPTPMPSIQSKSPSVTSQVDVCAQERSMRGQQSRSFPQNETLHPKLTDHMPARVTGFLPAKVLGRQLPANLPFSSRESSPNLFQTQPLQGELYQGRNLITKAERTEGSIFGAESESRSLVSANHDSTFRRISSFAFNGSAENLECCESLMSATPKSNTCEPVVPLGVPSLDKAADRTDVASLKESPPNVDYEKESGPSVRNGEPNKRLRRSPSSINSASSQLATRVRRHPVNQEMREDNKPESKSPSVNEDAKTDKIDALLEEMEHMKEAISDLRSRISLDVRTSVRECILSEHPGESVFSSFKHGVDSHNSLVHISVTSPTQISAPESAATGTDRRTSAHVEELSELFTMKMKEVLEQERLNYDRERITLSSENRAFEAPRNAPPRLTEWNVAHPSPIVEGGWHSNTNRTNGTQRWVDWNMSRYPTVACGRPSRTKRTFDYAAPLRNLAPQFMDKAENRKYSSPTFRTSQSPKLTWADGLPLLDKSLKELNQRLRAY